MPAPSTTTLIETLRSRFPDGAVVPELDQLEQRLLQNEQETELQIRAKTRHLAQQAASLRILYDVVASLNSSENVRELLLRFLSFLKEMVGANAATVRLLTRDNQMKLLSSIGIEEKQEQLKGVIPVNNTLCGQALSGKQILHQENVCGCPNEQGVELSCTDSGVIIVPLQHQEKTLGVYTLFVSPERQEISQEMDKLLLNIGQNLGMAIEKFRLEQEAHKSKLDQERAHIAHELHDSLAQTLASLKIRTQIMEENQKRADKHAAQESHHHYEILHLQQGLYRANRELRSLIANFRAPIHQQGLIESITTISDTFRKETGINTYFQHQCDTIQLPPETEGHLLRVIQESLVNIRKHSQAQNVRILTNCLENQRFWVLIEDDGIGFDTEQNILPIEGEHIGLSAMQQRMEAIGGTLEIESEPGEGTRISITGAVKEQNEEDIFALL
ncbi:MAG: GAF domain-containing protein [Gammaproteobacteria bacterium]|jgi:two-component system nitrate/nitrite sensor histidine kinase NarX|nr:GAF domain-containing protein [Gammaproteobacteria bacterium]MBT4605898.1 GAF domain-containing protein [Thiotrichales bacterium]MBT3472740.1 GAF domain-containing protein [Gammaproteobacteria bacterium]MBT3967644.1 GAF domain-containing protein [Gammaproteobacteria bacterium]MBT4081078.1 GAF domain-containing protein [Gammaproteobacteria bacterium]